MMMGGHHGPVPHGSLGMHTLSHAQGHRMSQALQQQLVSMFIDILFKRMYENLTSRQLQETVDHSHLLFHHLRPQKTNTRPSAVRELRRE